MVVCDSKFLLTCMWDNYVVNEQESHELSM